MKTPERRNKEWLLHIWEAIAKIENYIEGLAEGGFCEDSKTNEAVLFQLSIIGEAIIHVDSALLGKYDYPWHSVRALRNVITHEHFGIKMDKIWSVVMEDLPGLKEIIFEILNAEFKM